MDQYLHVDASSYRYGGFAPPQEVSNLNTKSNYMYHLKQQGELFLKTNQF